MNNSTTRSGGHAAPGTGIGEFGIPDVTTEEGSIEDDGATKE
jgi:hypothetical protein